MPLFRPAGIKPRPDVSDYDELSDSVSWRDNAADEQWACAHGRAFPRRKRIRQISY